MPNRIYFFLFVWALLHCELVPVSSRRIVAVGDLHGDMNQSLTVMRLTRLIDGHNRWSGGDTFFVQLGDVLDVGPADIEITRFLMQLGAEARLKGGDVIQLLGNHELRNLRGDYRAVDPASLAASGGDEGRGFLLSNKTNLGRYLRTRKGIFHHGPFLFMHGGFSTATSTMITNLKKVEEFNTELSEALMNGTISPLASGGLDLAESNIEDVANPILVRSVLNVKCGDLKKVLNKKFPGIQSVVVGHVPHDPRDFDDWRLCDGRLIDIDFGLSRWKKGDPGHVAALEIEEPTWHIQLIETTSDFRPISRDFLKGGYAVFTRWVLLIVLAALTAAVIGIVVTFLACCRKRPGLLDEQRTASDYGSISRV